MYLLVLALLVGQVNQDSLRAAVAQFPAIEEKVASKKLTQADIATVELVDTVVVIRREAAWDTLTVEFVLVSGLPKPGEPNYCLESASCALRDRGLVLTLDGKLAGRIVPNKKQLMMLPAAQILAEQSR